MSPATAPSATPKDIIRAAQCRVGFYRRTDDFCKLIVMDPRTFGRRMKRIDTMTLGELRRINRAVKFTDEEIIGLVRGTEK